MGALLVDASCVACSVLSFQLLFVYEQYIVSYNFLNLFIQRFSSYPFNCVTVQPKKSFFKIHLFTRLLTSNIV